MKLLNNKIKKNFLKQINWGKWFLILFGILLSIIVLIIPLISIFIEAFSKGIIVVLQNLKDSDMQHAIFLTIMIVIFTIPINLVFGISVAWLVTSFKFPGKQILLTILNIPFAISPVIVGLIYLLLYNSNGILGTWIDKLQIEFIFSFPIMLLVTIFVTCPFIVFELVPIMLTQGKNEEEAALILGASGWKIFWKVTFPKIRIALLYGIILMNARAIGEFGAVSVVSGLIRGETYTLPLQVELFYQNYNTIGAFTAASLLTLLAIIFLLLKNIIQWKLKYKLYQ